MGDSLAAERAVVKFVTSGPQTTILEEVDLSPRRQFQVVSESATMIVAEAVVTSVVVQ